MLYRLIPLFFICSTIIYCGVKSPPPGPLSPEQEAIEDKKQHERDEHKRRTEAYEKQRIEESKKQLEETDSD